MRKLGAETSILTDVSWSCTSLASQTYFDVPYYDVDWGLHVAGGHSMYLEFNRATALHEIYPKSHARHIEHMAQRHTKC